MIFDRDYRSKAHSVVGLQFFAAAPARVFNILSDPNSWGQERTPRISNSTAPSKIFLIFDGYERATLSITSWNNEFSELEVVIDGEINQPARERAQTYWQDVVLEIGRRLLSNPVVASSPAKVNIYFAVGSFLKDGFHKVASCYQALSLREKVLVESSVHFSIDFAGDYKLQSEASVPKDKSNLVYKAGDELIALGAKSGAEKVSFLINKSVPIAGGMAGGSADAAASLVALNELNQSGLEDRFQEAASKLGADVPFSLIGGTAIGLGRGQVLSKIKVETVLHWVMSPSSFGLSTPQVYRKLDVMRINEGVDVAHLEEPAVPEDLIVALQSGDVKSIANLMHNDLEVAAIAIRPELANILDAGRKAGSLRSMVSGSGPTIAHLAKDRVHAEQIANRLHNAGYEAIVTYTSQSGTRLER